MAVPHGDSLHLAVGFEVNQRGRGQRAAELAPAELTLLVIAPAQDGASHSAGTAGIPSGIDEFYALERGNLTGLG